jgi:hypothetical protein
LELLRLKEPECSSKIEVSSLGYKPNALFLCKTLVSSNKSEDFHYSLGFDWCLIVSTTGRGGGLASILEKTLLIVLLSITRQIILMISSTVHLKVHANLLDIMGSRKGDDVEILGIFS